VDDRDAYPGRRVGDANCGRPLVGRFATAAEVSHLLAAPRRI
jgi:hypothetical protein